MSPGVAVLYPNDLQVAVLYDRPVDALDGLVRRFAQMIEMRTGARFSVPEAKPGVFVRLYGAGDLMITFEYLDKPAEIDVFRAALGSPVTGLMCADIRHRLMRNKSHILVNVSHGVLGNSAEVHRLMAMIGRAPEGHSLGQFERRLGVAGLIGRLACEVEGAQAVHWTQSDQLLPAERFDDAATIAAPGPLHVHPFLFGEPSREGTPPRLGIRTFGAQHFVGREIRIEPSTLPWTTNYETILAFLRIATTEKGYVIPDGDTFGPENRALSYRVTHQDAAEGDVAFYVLEPLMHREHGFVAPDYVDPVRRIDDRAPPLALMPDDDDAKMDLVNEWREKRALAEGIGGRFEVRAAGTAPLPPVPPPRRPLAGRAVFGRKGI